MKYMSFLHGVVWQTSSENALVSVFLQVLEYYEGTPFLKSNRVGTFDEVLISRIHLSQCKNVWPNFVNHSKALDERYIIFNNVDYDVDESVCQEMDG